MFFEDDDSDLTSVSPFEFAEDSVKDDRGEDAPFSPLNEVALSLARAELEAQKRKIAELEKRVSHFEGVERASGAVDTSVDSAAESRPAKRRRGEADPCARCVKMNLGSPCGATSDRLPDIKAAIKNCGGKALKLFDEAPNELKRVAYCFLAQLNVPLSTRKKNGVQFVDCLGQVVLALSIFVPFDPAQRRDQSRLTVAEHVKICTENATKPRKPGKVRVSSGNRSKYLKVADALDKHPEFRELCLDPQSIGGLVLKVCLMRRVVIEHHADNLAKYITQGQSQDCSSSASPSSASTMAVSQACSSPTGSSDEEPVSDHFPPPPTIRLSDVHRN